MENLQITLLYSIKTDDAQDFTLDKIDFLNKTTKQFFDTIKEDQILQVKGVFGTYQEVEKEVEQQINNKVNLQQYINYSEKGNLIAIQYQNNMLFCLILPEKFFITKPINEKAIEIVLFRILQDLTDNIKFCLNDTILKENWYLKEVIPFSIKTLQRNDYGIGEEQNKEVISYDRGWLLSQEIPNDPFINSQTLSPKLIIIRNFSFDKDMEKRFCHSYFDITQKLIIQILRSQNKQINNLITIMKKEYQIKSLIDILNELSNKLEEMVKKIKGNLVKQFSSKENQWWWLKTKNDEPDSKKNIEAHVNDILQTVNYQNKTLCYTLSNIHQDNEFQKQIQKFLQIVSDNFHQILNQFGNKLNQIIEELGKQMYYEVHSISLKLSRCNNDPSGQVEKILQNEFQNIILNSELFSPYIPNSFLIIDVFQTKEKSTIYIIQTFYQNKYHKTHIFFQSQKTCSLKSIKQFDLQDTEKAVYFHDYTRGNLYIFNFKQKYVYQIIITEFGTINNEQNICYQQENNKYFLITKVAFLFYSNKFIVLSKDDEIYKQQDKDFEKVKCIEEKKNETQQTYFIPSIKPELKYNQLLTCPSGKYFYLANSCCCDRYDQNCMRIQSIEIRGPIKIFGDNCDVIILGQFNKKQGNQQENKAKIISNLVSQKKINKLENNEEKVVGNPALDIAKGSFIKFGPNSQFLLKEKKRNINIYVNQDYYVQMENYLTIMNINEIILSSTQVQFVEFKCEQIKNVVYSRVPLQLCTIENSNLIPLNDGFRQQSQTLTNISVDVDQKVKQLHLGFLEDHFSNYYKKIFVVGIIGKQSSGKSYLLNRVFGTRFSVSSARCTDGIWASIAYENDQTFLILDCEGLFNGARTDKEEIKMLAFLTAVCDITILNSDLTFNRHFNDLFKHLVEASKQLKGEKIFQGILYFVLRDVSSTDNSGVEEELLKNLERLKEDGSEEIVFLKKLFNNKFAVEKLVNNENKQFDQQINEVRKYFLNNFANQNRWKDGEELIQIMKILLCQLELSDNKDASLIQLYLRIEKIFEESNELWYDFTLDNVQCQNQRLFPNKYKFEKIQDHYQLLLNKDLLKQIYEDLEIKDSISTHNTNIQEASSHFKQMMQFRREQIISKTQKETCSINNQEVQTKIQNNLTNLQNFLIDQTKNYEFCLEKCNQCHLLCKQFKDHIDTSQKLKKLLDDQIKYLENQLSKLKITSEDEEKQKKKRKEQIEQEMKDAEIKLEGFQTQNLVNEIKEKQNQSKTSMMKYEFYDKINDCIILSFFGMNQDKEQTQTAQLNYIEKLQVQITQQIPELQSKKEQDMEIIKQQKIQLEKYDGDYKSKEQYRSQIKINQEKLLKEINQLDQQLLEKNTHLENIQSQINEIDIPNNENDINVPQVHIEEETQKLDKIQKQVKEYLQKKNEKTQELELLKQTDSNFYYNYLNKEIQEYEEKSNQLDEEIDNFKSQKRWVEDLKEQLKKEQSKKFGQNKQRIEQLTQQLKVINEQELNNQLNQCQIRKENLDQNSEQLEKFQLFKDCQEEIEREEQDIQIEQEQEKIIQGDFQSGAKNSKVINLFKNKKEEQMQQILNLIISQEKEIQDIKNFIAQNQQKIEKITKKNNLLDTQKRINSEISDIQNIKQELDKKQQDTIREINMQEGNGEQIVKNKQQLISVHQKLQDENLQVDQQINKLKSDLDQINEFSKHFNEYQVQSEQLKEKQSQLEKMDQFELFDLEQEQIQALLEQFQTKIFQIQQEKEQLMNQLEIFNQLEKDKQNLNNLKDTYKKLVQLDLNVHLCQRESHKCDQVCQACPEKICDNKAGHDEKLEHLCNKSDHRCNDRCQIIKCMSNCMQSFKHVGQHNCLNEHPCIEKCQYCNKNCKKDRSNPHFTTHDCQDTNCVHNCKFCPQKKCEEPHKHSLEKNNHFCNNKHECKEFCQEEGICKIDYTQIKATWKTQFSEFQYTRYIPNGIGKQKCFKQIPLKEEKHEGNHCCMEKTEKQFHFCNKQCPECNTFCDKQYGHLGLHSSDRHRNKENQIFTTYEGIQVQIKIEDKKDQKESTIRKYQIGESSDPETCDQSCKRRGRAHFHLVICEKNKCLEKKGEIKARHSIEKYVGFEKYTFDEVLCQDFWKLSNWDHPIYNELEIINKCNYYCPLCEQQKNHSFCDQHAWHTKDDKIKAHNFQCKEFHMKNQIQGINIAFVIDTTGSMGSYIDKCKTTIKDIIKQAKAKKNINSEEFDIKFAVVSYTDHAKVYKNTEQILKTQDFTSDQEIISFLDKLKADGGDDHPEAVLDGLNASIKLKWNDNYEKMLYLIADAPPHGKKRYHNYHDNHPQGCPCGLQQENILPILKALKVKLKILKLNQNIDMMITEFKKDFSDLVVFTPDKKQEDDFQKIIVSDVCQCLINNEITFQMQK